MFPILFVLPFVFSYEPAAFKTGKEFETSMATEIRWSSIGSELADQLRDLQSQSGVCILRDRRIDPHRLITVQTEFVSRAQVLRQISRTIPDGAVCFTEHLAFVGPAEAIHRYPIVLSQKTKEINRLRDKLNAVSFRRLTGKMNVSWENLSEPRQFLLDRAAVAGMTLTNPEAIPYDLWAEGTLPEMAFVELATLILNQFDLTFELQGPAPNLTIVPIDPSERVEYRYSVGSQLKSAMTSLWQKEAPDIDIHWSGSNATITATLSQHAVMYRQWQEVKYSDANQRSTTSTPKASIRTTNYRLSAQRATVRQLIDFFRSQNVEIEVLNEDSPELKETLSATVNLDTLGESQPGLKLFPVIFGKHFNRVDVLDERVVLSRE